VGIVDIESKFLLGSGMKYGGSEHTQIGILMTALVFSPEFDALKLSVVRGSADCASLVKLSASFITTTSHQSELNGGNVQTFEAMFRRHINLLSLCYIFQEFLDDYMIIVAETSKRQGRLLQSNLDSHKSQSH